MRLIDADNLITYIKSTGLGTGIDTSQEDIVKAIEACPVDYATYNFPDLKQYYDNCLECAEQHEQFAKWLEELRSYKDVEERYKPGDTVYCVGPDGSSYQICLYRYMSTVKDYIITYASDDNMNVNDALSEMCINSQAGHDIDVTLYKKQYVFATYKEAEEKAKDLDNKLNLLGEYRPVLSL